MSIQVYWKFVVPAEARLPISFKWALENRSNRHGIPSQDFVEGFLLASKDLTAEERRAVEGLLGALVDGKMVEFEWR